MASLRVSRSSFSNLLNSVVVNQKEEWYSNFTVITENTVDTFKSYYQATLFLDCTFSFTKANYANSVLIKAHLPFVIERCIFMNYVIALPHTSIFEESGSRVLISNTRMTGFSGSTTATSPIFKGYIPNLEMKNCNITDMKVSITTLLKFSSGDISIGFITIKPEKTVANMIEMSTYNQNVEIDNLLFISSVPPTITDIVFNNPEADIHLNNCYFTYVQNNVQASFVHFKGNNGESKVLSLANCCFSLPRTFWFKEVEWAAIDTQRSVLFNNCPAVHPLFDTNIPLIGGRQKIIVEKGSFKTYFV